MVILLFYFSFISNHLLDSINERILLPTSEYGPTSQLPSHLSPFTEYKEGEYVPLRREKLDKVKKAIEEGQYFNLEAESEEENDSQSSGDEDGEENPEQESIENPVFL
jgi:pescadillo protein